MNGLLIGFRRPNSIAAFWTKIALKLISTLWAFHKYSSCISGDAGYSLSLSFQLVDYNWLRIIKVVFFDVSKLMLGRALLTFGRKYGIDVNEEIILHHGYSSPDFCRQLNPFNEDAVHAHRAPLCLFPHNRLDDFNGLLHVFFGGAFGKAKKHFHFIAVFQFFQIFIQLVIGIGDELFFLFVAK